MYKPLVAYSQTLAAIFMNTRHNNIILILSCWTMTFHLTSCDNLRTGRQLYESGLEHYRHADHGDYHDGEGLSEAIEDFEKSIRKGYKDRDLFEKLALSYNFLNQDLANEERVYSLGLLAHPKDIEFYYRRGDCRKELRKHRDAFEDYNKAVVLDTARMSEYFSSALYQRGAMRYILGDTVNAEMDKQIAQSITDHDLRDYSDYCRLWR